MLTSGPWVLKHNSQPHLLFPNAQQLTQPLSLGDYADIWMLTSGLCSLKHNSQPHLLFPNAQQLTQPLCLGGYAAWLLR